MLCPKRKWKYTGPSESPDFDQEEFSPCLEEQCAAWRVKRTVRPTPSPDNLTASAPLDYILQGYCGLAGPEDLP